MFQIGDRVKIKNSTKEYILKEFKNNNESCIIKDGIEEIVVFVNCLELVEEKIYFTGEEIKLANNLGAIAEIYFGYNEQKKKCICVDIITSNTITAFFNNLDEINLFLKSLGFKEVIEKPKEVIEKPFDLVNYLKENLSPADFTKDVSNDYLGYDYCDEEWKRFVSIHKDILTVYFISICDTVLETLTKEKITPKQLKEAYKELGWL